MREKSESVASAFALTSGSQTKDQRLAVHRTILVVDVEGFSDQRRTNAHQVAVRDGLYRVMRDAFGRAGISWDDCDREDRGDGVLVLVPAEVPKSLLVESLPTAMVVGLCEHNAAHPAPERIRLRMALHAGEVCYDEHGVTGASVNLTFRLLEAEPLKHALAGSPSVLAIIASSWFFDEVVWHTDAAVGYRRVDVAVKKTTTIGWICLQDRTAAVPRPGDRHGRAQAAIGIAELRSRIGRSWHTLPVVADQLDVSMLRCLMPTAADVGVTRAGLRSCDSNSSEVWRSGFVVATSVY